MNVQATHPEGPGHNSRQRNPSGTPLCGGAAAREKFLKRKWLRLCDALALARGMLGTKMAKQEICDLAIAGKILLPGEIYGHYTFFEEYDERMYLMPSNIDWRSGELFDFDSGYGMPRKLHLLNDASGSNLMRWTTPDGIDVPSSGR